MNSNVISINNGAPNIRHKSRRRKRKDCIFRRPIRFDLDGRRGPQSRREVSWNFGGFR